MGSPMIGEFEMNQNDDYMNNNSAIQQGMDELTMISAVYDEYNGQHNLESPLMENDVLLRMQEAEMDDSNADANQNEDLRDLNDTTDQELGDLISNDVNYQARY